MRGGCPTIVIARREAAKQSQKDTEKKKRLPCSCWSLAMTKGEYQKASEREGLGGTSVFAQFGVRHSCRCNSALRGSPSGPDLKLKKHL